MPNEVYKATVKGLSALVAPRAAQRMVDDALRASNRTADDVSQSAMERLLRSRVKRELTGIFPDHVVDQALDKVAADLRVALDAPVRRGLFGRRRAEERGVTKRRRARGGATDERDDAGSDDPAAALLDDADEPLASAHSDHRATTDALDRAVKRSSAYLPAVDLPAEGAHLVFDAGTAAPAGDDGARRSVDPDAAARIAAAAASASAPPPARRGGLAVTPEALDRVIRTFADLETVSQIVVVDGMQVTQVRGEGLATERLAALTVATTRLLARGGELRTYSLERDDGVLFLFPTQGGAIVVLTKPHVNIGAVLAARAVLEEAA